MPGTSPFPLFYVAQHVSDRSSFPPPPMLIFPWNPGCLYTAISIPSFLGPGVVCFIFYPATSPHLMQTIHVQPCFLTHSAEGEPLQPLPGPTSPSFPYLFLHRFLNPSEMEDILPPLYPSLSLPPRPLPAALQTSLVLWPGKLSFSCYSLITSRGSPGSGIHCLCVGFT